MVHLTFHRTFQCFLCFSLLIVFFGCDISMNVQTFVDFVFDLYVRFGSVFYGAILFQIHFVV
jgi:hypothetical protein